jgi:hypothetical protein
MKHPRKRVKNIQEMNIFAQFDVIVIFFFFALVFLLIITKVYMSIIDNSSDSLVLAVLSLALLFLFVICFSIIGAMKNSVVDANYLYGRLAHISYRLLVADMVVCDGVLLSFYYLNIDLFWPLIGINLLIFIVFMSCFYKQRRILFEYDPKELFNEIHGHKKAYFEKHFVDGDYQKLEANRKKYRLAIILYVFLIGSHLEIIPVFIYPIVEIILYFLLLWGSFSCIKVIYKKKYIRHILLSSLLYMALLVLVTLLIYDVINLGEDLQGNLILMWPSGLGFLLPYAKLESYRSYIIAEQNRAGSFPSIEVDLKNE